MNQFILNCWVMGKIKTDAEVKNFVAKGYISNAEAGVIIATPKNK